MPTGLDDVKGIPLVKRSTYKRIGYANYNTVLFCNSSGLRHNGQ